jgi:hypothetical protein
MKYPMKTTFLLNFISPGIGILFFRSHWRGYLCLLSFHLSIAIALIFFLFHPVSLFFLTILLVMIYLSHLFLSFYQLYQLSQEDQMLLHNMKHLSFQPIQKRYQEHIVENQAFSLRSLLILVLLFALPNAILYQHIFHKTYVFYDIKNQDNFPNLMPLDRILIKVKPGHRIALGRLVVFLCQDLDQKFMIGRLMARGDENSKEIVIKQGLIEDQSITKRDQVEVAFRDGLLERESAIYDYFIESNQIQKSNAYLISRPKYPVNPFVENRVKLEKNQYLLLPDHRNYNESQFSCFSDVKEKQILGEVHSISDQKSGNLALLKRVGIQFLQE